MVGIALMDIYRNDEILADAELNHYSINRHMQDTHDNPTGFELYSDRIKRMFPSYILDNTLRLMPGPTTPVMNFEILKSILLSTDLERNEELSWANNEHRFLDG